MTFTLVPLRFMALFAGFALCFWLVTRARSKRRTLIVEAVIFGAVIALIDCVRF